IYTTFAYALQKVRAAAAGAHEGITVSTEERNTGQRAGEEVAQLYLDFPDIEGLPRVTLRGFERVNLAPGERKVVEFELDPRDLSVVTAEGQRQVMKVSYRVFVGGGQPGTGAAGRDAGFKVAQEHPLAR